MCAWHGHVPYEVIQTRGQPPQCNARRTMESRRRRRSEHYYYYYVRRSKPATTKQRRTRLCLLNKGDHATLEHACMHCTVLATLDGNRVVHGIFLDHARPFCRLHRYCCQQTPPPDVTYQVINQTLASFLSFSSSFFILSVVVRKNGRVLLYIIIGGYNNIV